MPEIALSTTGMNTTYHACNTVHLGQLLVNACREGRVVKDEFTRDIVVYCFNAAVAENATWKQRPTNLALRLECF